MTEYELIQEISGYDETGMPKCHIGVFHEIWGAEGVKRVVSENTFFKPNIEVFKHLNYTQIDFKFKAATDEDLAVMWRVLENFCTAANSSCAEKDESPLLSVNIMPQKHNGKYNLLAQNPIFYTLQPENASGALTVIRMVFSDKDVNAFTNAEMPEETEVIDAEHAEGQNYA